MAAQEPSKPQNAYWLWLSENREALTKEAGSGKAPVVGKLAGEKWKALSASAKAPFEKKAEELRASYAKAMEEFKASGGVPGKRRQEKAAAKLEKDGKRSKKADADHNRPKKPQNAYWLWLSENREALTKEAGSGKPPVVGKLAGEKWNALSAAAKAPFEKKAEELKAAYAKAMEEYRKTLSADVGDPGDEEDGGEKEEEEEVGKDPASSPELATKMAKESDGDAAVSEAKALGYARQLKALVDNKKLEVSPQKALAALKAAGGSTVRARAALSGA